MEELFIQQTDLIYKISRGFENFKKKGELNMTVELAKERLNLLNSYWDKFMDNHAKILNFKVKIKDVESHDYFKNDYFTLGEDACSQNRAQFTSFISSFSARNETEVSFSSNESSHQLPRISLPKFGGELTDWRNFKDMFTALVISNSHLRDVEKLHYLKTSLSGEPFQILQNIEITEANFSRAWRLLKERYENKRMLIHAHLTKIFSIKPAFKESSAELKRIYNTVMENLEALTSLGCPTEHWDLILQFIVLQSLDSRSRKDWEVNPSGDQAKFEDLRTFLQGRIRALEAMSYTMPSKNVHNLTLRTGNKKATQVCSFCKKNHFIVYCSDFQNKTVDQKKDFIKINNLCRNCLGKHSISQCYSQRSCQTCGDRHHTLIHEGKEKLKAISTNFGELNRTKILGTAKILVKGNDGKNFFVRALIDSGSEVSLISESIVQLLQLPRHSANLSVIGIGAATSTKSRGSVNLMFSSRLFPEFTYQTEAYILPKLTSYLPTKLFKIHHWTQEAELELADDLSSAPIQILLGADVYPRIIQEGLRKSPNGAIVAQKTTLGWILIGSIEEPNFQHSQSFHCSIDNLLLKEIRRFWEQEEPCAPSYTPSPADIECEKHFKETHRRLEDGRYVVRLPFKEDKNLLGDSIHQAKFLLNRLENRFTKNTELQTSYQAFLKEYEELDHMQLVQKTEIPLYVLPHHGVYKASSTTTKLRVVFNASAKTTSGHSLNDLLHKGPQLLPHLDDILIRWRKHRICFSSDIEKMYRGIRLHDDDQLYQVILWRDHINQPIQYYKLKTVTYGMSCSPFLAIRTLHQLAEDEGSTFPIGSYILTNDTYVDDILSGADSISEALAAQSELLGLLQKAQLKLRKWTSNCEELLEHLPPELVENSSSLSWQPSEFSMLGLLWRADIDSFFLTTKLKPLDEPITKKSVLSKIAQLFDPLGFFAPVIVTAKIFMQSLWLIRVSWEEELPQAESEKWRSYYDTLSALSTVRVPRWIGYTPSSKCELHAFADASTRAYGAAVYLRTSHEKGFNSVLIAAKTRVAPVKQVSLPRLELCAAQLAAQLSHKIKEALRIENLNVFLWSDSTIALSWIKSHPSRWETYVANRVSNIQVLLPDAVWKFTPTDENPADISSRGISSLQLESTNLWWSGPHWLTKNVEAWPKQPILSASAPTEERKKKKPIMCHLTLISNWIERFSNYHRLVRVTAYCLRFINKLRKKSSHKGTLEVIEISHARKRIIREVQESAFSEEIKNLKANKSIPRNSNLIKLNPILDHDNLLRVGGRLMHSLLSDHQKHPIILPQRHPFSTLIVKGAHRRTLHGGTQLTLATVRQEFWILRGRQTVKSVIKECVTCRRFRNSTLYQQMGNLPKERIRPSRPFLHAGVDYAGPVLLRTSKGRGQKSYKGYIAVFICFFTRAVHLEVVSDYTAEGFLAAYRRFTSRRGLCASITSDRGTNFVGAAAFLKSLFDKHSNSGQKIADQFSSDRTEWKFNPPAAPHFGGLWEAAVKSVKYHLKRVIGESKLTYEELSTLLCQIEAILNSRPLQPITDDPEDLEPLTPAHFLLGQPLTTLPENNPEINPASITSRWKLLQSQRQAFWRKWSAEYIQQLQSRNKWEFPNREIAVGDLVLIRQENTSPCQWPLARITHLHYGQDGLVRVATLKTAKTESIQRPIVKLCPLLESSKTTPAANSFNNNLEEDELKI